MQRELLDRRVWTTRHELATAIFEWIEGFYNPIRRHSVLDYPSPIEYERVHTQAATAARTPYQWCLGKRVRLPRRPVDASGLLLIRRVVGTVFEHSPQVVV